MGWWKRLLFDSGSASPFDDKIVSDSPNIRRWDEKINLESPTSYCIYRGPDNQTKTRSLWAYKVVFFTPSGVQSTSDRTPDGVTGIRPPRDGVKDLVWSASDPLSDVWTFVSQRQNESHRPRMSDSSTNQMVFHRLLSDVHSSPASH